MLIFLTSAVAAASFLSRFTALEIRVAFRPIFYLPPFFKWFPTPDKLIHFTPLAFYKANFWTAGLNAKTGACGFWKKIFPARYAHEVFFSKKSCPSDCRVQVSCSIKSHRRLLPRVTDLKRKNHERRKNIKREKPTAQPAGLRQVATTDTRHTPFRAIKPYS